ncbi:MAG: tRNA modification GTPase [Phycisphaerae bacterium]
MFDTQDTIVAVSSAPGSAARGIVRLSGPAAAELAGVVFEGAEPLASTGGFRAVDGLVRFGPEPLELPARAQVFRSPHSYTRQDVVELHVPGPAAVTTALSAALIDAGARQANPGEFTARAFFAGRLDLSQAQAVADVIDAADDAMLRCASAALGGRVHRLCEAASGRLTEALATVEASIDLAEEDIQLESPQELSDRLEGLSERLGRVAKEAADMPEAGELPEIVLTGRPNVGKSSLLNALCGTDRAIVSAMAGTTRDVLTATVALGQAAVELCDAAGFAPSGDDLSAATTAAARSAVARADVVLLVADLSAGGFDAERPLLQDIRAVNRRAPVLLVGNKKDLTGDAGLRRLGRLGEEPALPTVATSAVSGEGLDELRRRLTELLQLAPAGGSEHMGLHERQKRCLQDASAAAARAAETLRGTEELADTAELVAVELREALARLGEISGEVVNEDVLANIFSRFCVGK